MCSSSSSSSMWAGKPRSWGCVLLVCLLLFRTSTAVTGIRARANTEPIDSHLDRRGRSLPEISHVAEDLRTRDLLGGSTPRDSDRSREGRTSPQEEPKNLFSPLEDFFHFIDSAVDDEADHGPGRSIPHRQPHADFAEALGMFPSLFGQHGFTGGLRFSRTPTHVIVQLGLPHVRPESLRAHVFGDHLVANGHIVDPRSGQLEPFQRAVVLPPGLATDGIEGVLHGGADNLNRFLALHIPWPARHPHRGLSFGLPPSMVIAPLAGPGMLSGPDEWGGRPEDCACEGAWDEPFMEMRRRMIGLLPQPGRPPWAVENIAGQHLRGGGGGLQLVPNEPHEEDESTAWQRAYHDVVEGLFDAMEHEEDQNNNDDDDESASPSTDTNQNFPTMKVKARPPFSALDDPAPLPPSALSQSASMPELADLLPEHLLRNVGGPSGGSGWSISESTAEVNGHRLPGVVRIHFFGPANESVRLSEHASAFPLVLRSGSASSQSTSGSGNAGVSNSSDSFGFALRPEARSVALVREAEVPAKVHFSNSLDDPAHDHGSNPLPTASNASLSPADRRRKLRKGDAALPTAAVVSNVSLPFDIDASHPLDVRSHADGHASVAYRIRESDKTAGRTRQHPVRIRTEL